MSDPINQENHPRNRIRLASLCGLMLIMLLAIVAKAMPYILMNLGWEIDSEDWRSYLWNLSPLMALAIVTGTSLSHRLSWLLPLGAWFLGDVAIWIVSGRIEWAFYPTQPIVYGLVIGLYCLGMLGARWKTGQHLGERIGLNLGMGLLGASLFFLISNLAVWVFDGGQYYDRSVNGLVQCYVMAIPFYRNSLLSMLIYVPVLSLLMTPVIENAIESSMGEESSSTTANASQA